MEDLYKLIIKYTSIDYPNTDPQTFNKYVDNKIIEEISYIEKILEENCNIIIETFLLADLDYLNNILYNNHFYLYNEQ